MTVRADSVHSDEMHVITAAILRAAVPRCSNPDGWVDPINEAMLLYGISDDVDFVVEFLAQCAHESGSFNRLEENLIYSAERLTQVWPSRFPTLASAVPYAAKPGDLAEFVYGGRMGNTQKGDGYKYRGRGLFMVTGRSNYSRVARMLNDPLIINCPDRLQTKRVAALASAAHWASNPKFRELADDTPTDDDYADFVSITRLVNGGVNGLAERSRLRDAFRAALSTS